MSRQTGQASDFLSHTDWHNPTANGFATRSRTVLNQHVATPVNCLVHATAAVPQVHNPQRLQYQPNVGSTKTIRRLRVSQAVQGSVVFVCDLILMQYVYNSHT